MLSSAVGCAAPEADDAQTQGAAIAAPPPEFVVDTLDMQSEGATPYSFRLADGTRLEGSVDVQAVLDSTTTRQEADGSTTILYGDTVIASVKAPVSGSPGQTVFGMSLPSGETTNFGVNDTLLHQTDSAGGVKTNGWVICATPVTGAICAVIAVAVIVGVVIASYRSASACEAAKEAAEQRCLALGGNFSGECVYSGPQIGINTRWGGIGFGSIYTSRTTCNQNGAPAGGGGAAPPAGGPGVGFQNIGDLPAQDPRDNGPNGP